MSKVLGTFKITEKVAVPGEGEKKVDVVLAVLEPSLEDFRESRRMYNTVFSDAIKNGAVMRGKIEEVLRQQAIWTDEKEAEFKDKQREVWKKEKVLATGGIKLSEARDIAVQIKEHRKELMEILSPRTQFDINSAEGQADNEQFNCLVSRVVVYNDRQNTRYFANYQNYLNRATEDAAVEGARLLAKNLYGVGDDNAKKTPEDRFLIKFGFADEKGRLINKDKKFVDEQNRRVNELGKLVNEKEQVVDDDGTPLDKDGDYLVDVKPFLDDDGNAVESDWGYGVYKKTEEAVSEPVAAE